MLHKYDAEIYNRVMEVFDMLPIGAIVNNKFFTVHGGLSPSFKKISSLNKIDRFKEIPRNGLFCDILWSDPTSNESGVVNQIFLENKERRCSFYFGVEATKQFLKKNKLLSVIRAHEV